MPLGCTSAKPCSHPGSRSTQMSDTLQSAQRLAGPGAAEHLGKDARDGWYVGARTTQRAPRCLLRPAVQQAAMAGRGRLAGGSAAAGAGRLQCLQPRPVQAASQLVVPTVGAKRGRVAGGQIKRLRRMRAAEGTAACMRQLPGLRACRPLGCGRGAGRCARMGEYSAGESNGEKIRRPCWQCGCQGRSPGDWVFGGPAAARLLPAAGRGNREAR